ncbi:MAG: MMPL family transporter [bacterium]|nr:MMPL family transporter [bacterium]
MRRWADFLVRHPRPAWTFVILLTVVAGFGVARVEVDDVPSSIFRSGDEDFRRLESVWRDFGSDDNDAIVLVDGGGDVFTPEGARLLRELERVVRAVPGVERVTSIADVPVWDRGPLPRALLPAAGAGPEDFDAARRLASTHPLVAGKLVTQDGMQALVAVTLEGENLSIETLDDKVDDVRDALASATRESSFRARLTGVPVIRRVLFQTIDREQKLFSALGALVGFLVGLAIFRRPGPILITSAASVLSSFCALGMMGWIGERMNLLNVELPLIIMIIAYTDAVHLMIHILRRRSEGRSPTEAAGDAVRHLGLACALTSFTTAVGFGSLAVSRIEHIQRFGILFACAVWMTFLVVVTLVPLASILFLRDSHRRPMEKRYGALHAPAERMIRSLLRHARPVSVAGITMTAALFVLALRLVPDNRLTEAMPPDAPSVTTLAVIEESFGGVLSSSILLEWPEGLTIASPEVVAAVREAHAALVANPFTQAPTSVLDLLTLLPGEPDPTRIGLLPKSLTEGFLRPELCRTLIRSAVPDAGSAVAEPAYAELFETLEEIRGRHPRIEMNVTGTAYLARRNINLIIEDFALGLLVAAIAIFAAMTLAFRSFRLGAISIVPNAFPLVVAAATLVVLGIELQVSSVIAFTVLLGIAVDDTIHLIARFRRELAATGDVTEAAVRAYLGVGRALVVTTFVLAGGFGVMLASELPTSQLFAVIGCIGLVAALLGDLLLLPAMMVAFLRR